MPQPSATIGTGARLADGQWHRLHPATPVLRGGLALVAIVGIVIVNLRDEVLNLVFGGDGTGPDYDPLVYIYENQLIVVALLVVLGAVLLFVAGFYFSWRMHTFRITEEQVEVRSGIAFRTNRRGRLDRIQGIDVGRPLLARLFGAARLDITVAGMNSNVQLAFLDSRAADELRREILLLASGTPEPQAPSDSSSEQSGVVGRRIDEFMAPELDPALAPAQSVVQLHLGRVIGSLLLSGFTIFVMAAVIALIVVAGTSREPFFLLGFLPAVIGLGGFYVSRFTRALRYSIASTPDGIRIGHGLLSTGNETLPPGRIHAVQVSQPLLWRAPGWWEIKINRASQSRAKGAAGQANTTILPVGNLAETQRVLELVLPGLATPEGREILHRGMSSRGSAGGFITSPPRARIIRWFSWRRNGFALPEGFIVLRRGAIWRELFVVPQARMQGISLSQGPLERRLGLAAFAVNTVPGPVDARVGAIDRDDAIREFAAMADAAVRAAGVDISHHWRVGLPVAPEADERPPGVSEPAPASVDAMPVDAPPVVSDREA